MHSAHQGVCSNACESIRCLIGNAHTYNMACPLSDPVRLVNSPFHHVNLFLYSIPRPVLTAFELNRVDDILGRCSSDTNGVKASHAFIYTISFTYQAYMKFQLGPDYQVKTLTYPLPSSHPALLRLNHAYHPVPHDTGTF